MLEFPIFPVSCTKADVCPNGVPRTLKSITVTQSPVGHLVELAISLRLDPNQ